MNVEHVVIAKMFEGDVNFFLKGREEKQPTNKSNYVWWVNF